MIRRTAVLVLCLLCCTPSVAARPRASIGRFAGGPLAADPAAHTPRNRDYEPGMAVAPDGSIWVAASTEFFYQSDDPRYAGVSGDDIWMSKDRGRTFRWVADPADLTGTASKPGLGGGDTDIATASDFNRDRSFNVYAVTSWVGSATLSVSRDSGRTWISSPISLPPHDRPWIVADGACAFYVTFSAPSAPAGQISVRYDLCDPTAETLGTTSVSTDGRLDEKGGKPAVDVSRTSRYHHTLYVPVMGCEAGSGTPNTGCSAVLRMAVSRDGGKTFTRYVVGHSPADPTVQFPMVATDAAGTAYATWGDFESVYFSSSRDGGVHWTDPRLIDAAPAVKAILPQVAGGRAGEVVLAWYGLVSSRPEVHVFVARSWDGGRTFHVASASPTVLAGVPCASDLVDTSCSDQNSLRDDFGVAINPHSHRVTVAYTSNRPEGDRVHDFVAYATEL